MILKQPVHVERRGTHCALVGQVCRFESHLMVSAHVVEELPLEHLWRRMDGHVSASDILHTGILV